MQANISTIAALAAAIQRMVRSANRGMASRYDTVRFGILDVLKQRGQGYRLTIDPVGGQALQACLPPRLQALVVATSGRLGDKFTVYTDQKRMIHESHFPSEPGADDTTVSKQIDRFTLRQILLSDLDGRVHFGQPFSRYEYIGNDVAMHFEDGSCTTTNLLVGADGVNSRVRGQFLPQAVVADTGMRAILVVPRLCGRVSSC